MYVRQAGMSLTENDGSEPVTLRRLMEIESLKRSNPAGDFKIGLESTGHAIEKASDEGAQR